MTDAIYFNGNEFHYEYDSVGNILTKVVKLSGITTTTTYTYYDANRLLTVNGLAQQFDANGNLVNDGTKTYAYDAANRLKSITQGSNVSSYSYNGLGDRVSQTNNGVTTNYSLDLNAGLTQVLSATTNDQQPATNYYLYGLGRIGEQQPSGFAYHLGDALGSVRQLVDASGVVQLTRSYEPYGTALASGGNANSAFGFTGEQIDSQSGFTYLRARYLDSQTGRFISRDTYAGNAQSPMSFNAWLYAHANAINLIDPSGQIPCSMLPPGEQVNCEEPPNPHVPPPPCEVGRWDCESVTNVRALKQAFLDSAMRHNKIPTMDNNGFAALLATVIVSERRIGNVPPDSDPRSRKSQWLEDLVASFGCTVSGSYIKAAVDEGDYGQAWRYFTNQDVPQRATVGIGNVWLKTAANIWKGQACSSLGDCTAVQVSKLQTTNAFGITVNINNPFGTQIACVHSTCAPYQPTETESYVDLTMQLLSREMNIEYVAANLESGALRAIAKGFKPSAFNSATWHLRGVQTDKEIGDSSWNPGGAIYILDDIPTALTVLGITSSWNVSLEPQYAIWKNP